MRIIYVANHNNGQGDDEGAIAWSLEQEGHDVVKVLEENGQDALKLDGDLLLFHKWQDTETIRKVGIPKVFWYFDLVHEVEDSSLIKKTKPRRSWIAQMTRVCDLGAMSDGTWIKRNPNDKLMYLTQGADERVMGKGKRGIAQPPLMFLGSVKVSAERERFLRALKSRYKGLFRASGNLPGRRHYGRDMADLIACTKMMIAPPSPVSDNYWSNRVYMLAGFHSFILHPYCEGLLKDYQPDSEVAYYKTYNELIDKIYYYMESDKERERVKAAAFKRTQKEHTYRHRTRTLLRAVEERVLLRSTSIVDPYLQTR